MELDESQSAALEGVRAWFERIMYAGGQSQFCTDTDPDAGCPPWGHSHGNAHGSPVFAVGGLAGTGKSTIMGALREVLGDVRPAYGAPTNKAAHVLRTRTGEGSTYHALAYYPKPYLVCTRSRAVVHAAAHRCAQHDGAVTVVEGGRCGCAAAWEGCQAHPGLRCAVAEEVEFELRPALKGFHGLVVIDEASMIDVERVEEIRSLGIPTLLVGDYGQLPPVRGEMNPWMLNPDAVLTVNHRQSGEGSGVVALAHRVRAGERAVAGARYGEGVAVIRGSDRAFTGLMERFTPGPERALIVWRNRTRVAFNGMMRAMLFGGGIDPQDVRVGDRLVSLGNAKIKTMDSVEALRPSGEVFVHNGQMGIVVQVGRTTEKLIELRVRLDDGAGSIVWTQAARHWFGTEEGLKVNDARRPQGVRGSWHPWDYGYALTCHKAQGSQFDEVIVIDEGAREYPRWMYTAVTRAAKKLIVVKW